MKKPGSLSSPHPIAGGDEVAESLAFLGELFDFDTWRLGKVR